MRFFQVDAFSSRPFAGNPAAVMPLKEWLPDEMLAAIAGLDGAKMQERANRLRAQADGAADLTELETTSPCDVVAGQRGERRLDLGGRPLRDLREDRRRHGLVDGAGR